MPSDDHNAATSQSTDGAENSAEYAEAICNGLNRFVEHSRFTFEYTTDRSDGGTRITLSPEQADVETTAVHEYEVEDEGERIKFRFDGEKLTIVSDVTDWSVFDYRLHTGEAVSCIIESGWEDTNE